MAQQYPETKEEFLPARGDKPQATPQVYRAIALVAKDMAEQGVGKTRVNEQQHYKFRGIDEVMNALAPSLARHGLMILPRVVARTKTEHPTRDKQGVLFYVIVESEFDFVAAADGTKHTCKTFGEAMDSGDKATNKAMSAAFKYAAFQAFCIPTEGDGDADADALTHEPAADIHAQAQAAFDRQDTGAAGAAARGAQSVENSDGKQPSPAAHAPVSSIPPICPACKVPMKDQRDKRAKAEAEGKPHPPPAWVCRNGHYDAKAKKHIGCAEKVWPADPNEGKPPPDSPTPKPQPKRAEDSPQLAIGLADKIREYRGRLNVTLGEDLKKLLIKHGANPENVTQMAVLKILQAEDFERETNATKPQLPPGAVKCPCCDSTNIRDAADPRDYQCADCMTCFRKP